MNKVLFVLPLALLLGCKKDDPEASLPPATQEGKNTFGCLVNGQPWTPQGNAGFANYAVSYELFPDGGVLSVNTTRIYGSDPTDFQSIALWCKRLTTTGVYSFWDKKRTIATFTNPTSKCVWRSADSTSTFYKQGSLTITRLDVRAGIIAGTFDFTLYKPGCDTIKVTQGRFDKKL